MTRRPTKPGDRPRVLANHELVVVAALLAGAKTASVDTEDIAMKANELAPGRFAWRKYKDQINIDTVRKRLWDATKPEKGSLLIGSEKTGWRLTVLVNRYDGVDLPDDACRLLVIDGLPEVQGLTERVEANLLEGTDTYLLRQIQKLEQGMGRGVRSEEDRCAVLLLGARLTQRINQPNARAMFTPATQVQMELGREVTQQIKGKPISDLRGILDLCIERNTAQGVKWWQAGRSRLAQAPEGQASRVDSVAISQRAAFDHLMSNQVYLAESVLQTSVANSQKPAIGRHF